MAQRYHITIGEQLDESWSNWFDGPLWQLVRGIRGPRPSSFAPAAS
jgi:hypothetical protein